MTERVGDWMQVYTGRKFWPVDPRPQEIDILDIAHALAMQCRYGGHARKFYSVAEHCVKLAEKMPAPLQLTALLHDASEAYMVDVPRPLKKSMPEYRQIEERLMSAIAERFGFLWPLPDEVAEADTRMLMDERLVLMAEPPEPWSTDMPALGVVVECWPPTIARSRFLAMFYELQGAPA